MLVGIEETCSCYFFRLGLGSCEIDQNASHITSLPFSIDKPCIWLGFGFVWLLVSVLLWCQLFGVIPYLISDHCCPSVSTISQLRNGCVTLLQGHWWYEQRWSAVCCEDCSWLIHPLFTAIREKPHRIHSLLWRRIITLLFDEQRW